MGKVRTVALAYPPGCRAHSSLLAPVRRNGKEMWRVLSCLKAHARRSFRAAHSMKLCMDFTANEYAEWVWSSAPNDVVGQRGTPAESPLDCYIEQHVENLRGVTTYVEHGQPMAELAVFTAVFVERGPDAGYRGKHYGAHYMTFALPPWTRDLISFYRGGRGSGSKQSKPVTAQEALADLREVVTQRSEGGRADGAPT